MTGVSDLADRLGWTISGRVATHESLAPFTTYKLGGGAAVYAEPDSPADVDAVGAAWREVAADAPLLIVGRGSNLLISDEGWPGLAVRLGSGFAFAYQDGTSVRSGGATPLPWLARFAARRGLAGLSFGVAVPGSVGGAVRMNAGAHGSETVDVLASAVVTDLRTSARKVVLGSELDLGYRRSGLRAEHIVEEGTYRLMPGVPSALEEEMREITRWRRDHQPGGQPNAGSVFANPPGDAAGRLIEAVGGKGWREGAASVSLKHANFIVTEPGATATDVARLIARVRLAVRREFAVTLNPEMRLVGRFPDDVTEALALQ